VSSALSQCSHGGTISQGETISQGDSLINRMRLKGNFKPNHTICSPFNNFR